jgi:hypothetical protein
MPLRDDEKMIRDMNQAERAEELDRQLLLVTQGKSLTVICPWCGIISDAREFDPNETDCCPDFTDARNERGVRQIASIDRQQREMMEGLRTNQKGRRKAKGGVVTRDSIECPYCGGINRPENALGSPEGWKRPNVSPYCCDLFVAAVIAIAQRIHTQQQIEKVGRINEAISRAERN